MNARIAVMMVCFTCIGFAVGYGWPREAAAHRDEQLVSLTGKIATDVASIQNQLSHQASQCPNGSAVAQAERNEAQNNERQKVADADRTHRDVTQLPISQQAEVTVMRGISSGRWTDSDAQELRMAMDGLSAAQKQAVVAPLLQAINAQQIKLEVAFGGPL